MLNVLLNNFIDSKPTINETIKEFTLEMEVSNMNDALLMAFFEHLKCIPKRDAFEFVLTISGNKCTICNIDELSQHKIIRHFSVESEDEDDLDIEINLSIWKTNKENTISVYHTDSFFRTLNELKIVDALNSINDNFNNYLLFEVFSEIETTHSEGIYISSHKNKADKSLIIKESTRTLCLTLFKESSNCIDFLGDLLPNDFNLKKASTESAINDFFNKIKNCLSLIYISNFSSFKGDDLQINIHGYKNITNTITNFIDTENYLYKLYQWAYTDGDGADKLGLLRNILSLHLDPNGNVIFDKQAYSAVHSNYLIYLKGNVDSYLEIKNKINDVILDSTNKTYTIVDDLLSSFKNNIFIIITFLLTVLLVNGLKDNGAKEIFSKEYLSVVIIVAIISYAWAIFMEKDITERFDESSSTVKELLINNYSSIIMVSEIEDTIDPIIIKNKAYLNRQKKKYMKYWVYTILSFVLIYWTSYSYFNDPQIQQQQQQYQRLY